MRFRIPLAIVSLLLAAVSVANYAHDRAQREPVRQFLHEFTIDQRRPVENEVLELAPAADLATDASSLAALADAVGTVNLSDKTPQERTLWLRSVERVPEELQRAVRLSLVALRARPGWPYHMYMAGKLAYVLERRTAQREYRPEQWIVPLTVSTRRLSSDPTVWSFLAGAYLESWGELPPASRASVLPVVKRAFADLEFTRAALPFSVEAFGAQQTFAMIPDEPQVLARAVDFFNGQGNFPVAVNAYSRWRRAEWSARAADLALAERRYELSDFDGLRQACSTWASRHNVYDFDDERGRKQVARILDLWPDDRGGAWSSDPRGEIIRYFLDGREAFVPGAALARSAAVLSDVPEVTQAICRLAGGDFYGAQRMMVTSETSRSFEWTPLIVRLARERLTHGDLDNARDALDHLAPGAQQECDVLLVERDLRKAAKQPDGEVSRSLAGLEAPFYRADDFSDNGTLSLCIDPLLSAAKQLDVRFDVAAPALVEYGWGDGTSGVTTLAASRTSVVLPLAGLAWRRNFAWRTAAGAKPVPTGATIN